MSHVINVKKISVCLKDRISLIILKGTLNPKGSIKKNDGAIFAPTFSSISSTTTANSSFISSICILSLNLIFSFSIATTL